MDADAAYPLKVEVDPFLPRDLPPFRFKAYSVSSIGVYHRFFDLLICWDIFLRSPFSE